MSVALALVSALAGDPKPVVLIAPAVTESVREHTTGRLLSAMVEATGRADVELRTPSPCPTGSASCVDAEIARGIKSGVEYVVRTRVRFDGSDYRIDVQLDDANGTTLASKSDVCDICGEAELVERVADTLVALNARLDRIGDMGTLQVLGEPEGAEVRIDGEVVGALPFTGRVAPGAHEIEVAATGRLPATRTIDLAAGVNETIELELATKPEAVQPEGPEDPPDVIDAPRSPLVPAGWAVAVAGVAGLGAGVGLAVLNGRPHQPTCPPDVIDPNGMCPNEYTTLGAGIGALAGGALAVAGGVTMVVVGRKQQRATVGVGPRSVRLQLRF